MIPRRIHQTWRITDQRGWSPSERRWVASWRANAAWRHELSGDAQCLRLIERRHPELVEAYRALAPVEKADVWRCAVLLDEGGVYGDFDTACRVPLGRWLEPGDELVLGLMSDYRARYPQWRPRRRLASGGAFDPRSPWRDQPVTFTNWTMAAVPEHPLVADALGRIAVNLADPYFVAEDPGWVCKKTGPGVITDALEAWLGARGTTLAAAADALAHEPEVRIDGVRLLDHGAFHGRLVAHAGMRSWAASRRGVAWLRHRAHSAFMSLVALPGPRGG